MSGEYEEEWEMESKDWQIKDIINYIRKCYPIDALKGNFSESANEQKMNMDVYRDFSRRIRDIIGKELVENEDYWIKNGVYKMKASIAIDFIETSEGIQNFLYKKIEGRKGDREKNKKYKEDYFKVRAKKFCQEIEKKEPPFIEEYIPIRCHELCDQNSREECLTYCTRVYEEVLEKLDKYKFLFWILYQGSMDDMLLHHDIDSGKFWEEYDKLKRMVYDNFDSEVYFDAQYAESLFKLMHPRIYFPLSQDEKDKFKKEEPIRKADWPEYWIPSFIPERFWNI